MFSCIWWKVNILSCSPGEVTLITVSSLVVQGRSPSLLCPALQKHQQNRIMFVEHYYVVTAQSHLIWFHKHNTLMSDVSCFYCLLCLHLLFFIEITSFSIVQKLFVSIPMIFLISPNWIMLHLQYVFCAYTFNLRVWLKLNIKELKEIETL